MRSKTVGGLALWGAAAYFAGATVNMIGSAGPLVLASQIIGGTAAALAGFVFLLESAQPETEVRETFTHETNE